MWKEQVLQAFGSRDQEGRGEVFVVTDSVGSGLSRQMENLRQWEAAENESILVAYLISVCLFF